MQGRIEQKGRRRARLHDRDALLPEQFDRKARGAVGREGRRPGLAVDGIDDVGLLSRALGARGPILPAGVGFQGQQAAGARRQMGDIDLRRIDAIGCAATLTG